MKSIAVNDLNLVTAGFDSAVEPAVSGFKLQRINSQATVCADPSCERTPVARSLCSKHYQRLKKSNAFEPIKARGCKVKNCLKVHEGLGYCKTHRLMFKKHGDPLIRGISSSRFTSEGMKSRWSDEMSRSKMLENFARGENHHAYKGGKTRMRCANCSIAFECYPNYNGVQRRYCSRLCAVRSQDTREKLRAANLGKKASEETRLKLSKAHLGLQAGPKSGTWKGGLSNIGQRLRSTPEYASWRKGVLSKDDYTCQLCGQRGGRLTADHYPYPFAKYPEKRLDPNNGRALCKPCHDYVTYVTKEWRYA